MSLLDPLIDAVLEVLVPRFRRKGRPPRERWSVRRSRARLNRDGH